eukprot:TRINITY_DN10673_c0_g1_i1.p3 TRINITY_DN10673_c0_g1~~TRINITY_DN10673_c0_g1_i1.p3  ORF type:complete len:151 (-),score=27.64 TRINITY_DN10673_c0_g1_i1:669-1121(-)
MEYKRRGALCHPTCIYNLTIVGERTRIDGCLPFFLFWCIFDIFDKIEVGCFLVGHTHDDIDQFFSIVSKMLDKNEVYSSHHMMEMWDEKNKMPSKSFREEEVGDFKKFAQGFSKRWNWPRSQRTQQTTHIPIYKEKRRYPNHAVQAVRIG